VSFPSRFNAFPRPARASKRRRSRPRAEEVPEDERTHVRRGRLSLGCGRSRIGLDLALLVDGEPNCPGCRKHLRDVRESARIVGEAFSRWGFLKDGGGGKW
jgi:hypothetical protein